MCQNPSRFQTMPHPRRKQPAMSFKRYNTRRPFFWWGILLMCIAFSLEAACFLPAELPPKEGNTTQADAGSTDTRPTPTCNAAACNNNQDCAACGTGNWQCLANRCYNIPGKCGSCQTTADCSGCTDPTRNNQAATLCYKGFCVLNRLSCSAQSECTAISPNLTCTTAPSTPKKRCLCTEPNASNQPRECNAKEDCRTLCGPAFNCESIPSNGKKVCLTFGENP
jgi:hypothetical protein